MNLSNTAKVIKESETRKILTSKGNQEIKEKIRKASQLMFQRNEKAQGLRKSMKHEQILIEIILEDVLAIEKAH